MNRHSPALPHQLLQLLAGFQNIRVLCIIDERPAEPLCGQAGQAVVDMAAQGERDHQVGVRLKGLAKLSGNLLDQIILFRVQRSKQGFFGIVKEFTRRFLAVNALWQRQVHAFSPQHLA